jgi:hypothetical protein
MQLQNKTMSGELTIYIQDKGRPLTCMKTQRGNRGLPLLMLNLDTRWVWVVNATPRPLFPPAKFPAIHCRGGWMGLRFGLGGYAKDKTSSTTGVRTSAIRCTD